MCWRTAVVCEVAVLVLSPITVLKERWGYSGKRRLMEDSPPLLHQTDTFGTNISIDAMTKLKMESYVREARALS